MQRKFDSIIMPQTFIGRGIIKWCAVSVCPCVCLSVCRVPRPNSRTERHRKPKIVRMEGMGAHHTSNPWTCLEVKRSKVKVTRPINDHAVNVQYLLNGKVYELQTWYTDGARWPVSPTSAMTSKAKDQGRKVRWCVWQVFVAKSRTKRSRNTNISRKVAYPRTIMRTSFEVKGQRSRSLGRLMARPEVRHIFRMERPTNF